MVTRNLLKNSNNNVFALKVEKTTYKGQFLILIKHINPKWNNNMLFRAKITKNKVLPKNFEELEELEYIKITCVPYEERFLPLCENSNRSMYGKTVFSFQLLLE